MLSKTSVLTQRLSSSVLQRRCASGVAAVLDSGVSTHKDRNILRESTNDVQWSSGRGLAARLLDDDPDVQYASLHSALEAVQPGHRNRITIGPGVHRGPLHVDKPVEIVGRGPRHMIRIEGDPHASSSTLYLSASNIVLRNLTIVQTSSNDAAGHQRVSKEEPLFSAIHISRGQPTIEACDISSLAGTGIFALGFPIVRDCYVHDCRGEGVVHQFERADIQEQSSSVRMEIENSLITTNLSAGIKLDGRGTAASIVNNRLVNNAGSGLVACSCASGLVENNKVYGNRNGIEVRSGGAPVIRNNEIFGAPWLTTIAPGSVEPLCAVNPGLIGYGLYSHSGAAGEFSGNRVYDTQMAGILISGLESTTCCTSNLVHHCKGGGFVVQHGAAPLISQNKVYHNEGVGLQVTTSARPSVCLNHVHHCSDCGICVLDDGCGTFFQNSIWHNSAHGILVSDCTCVTGDEMMPEVQIRENHVVDNLQCGIHLVRSAGMVVANHANKNGFAGVQLSATLGSTTVEGNECHCGKRQGLVACDHAAGTIVSNHVSCNATSGLEVRGGSVLNVRSNRIHACKGPGLSVMGGAGGCYEYNNVFDNHGEALLVRGADNPAFNFNSALSFSTATVQIDDSATATFTKNTITTWHHGAAVEISESAKPVFLHNKITCETTGAVCVRAVAGCVVSLQENSFYFSDSKAWIITEMAKCSIAGNSQYNTQQSARLHQTPGGSDAHQKGAAICDSASAPQIDEPAEQHSVKTSSTRVTQMMKVEAFDTLVVDASGGPGCDFHTISEALLAASEGACIRVRPGLYTEALCIQKRVKIIGDTDSETSTHAARYHAHQPEKVSQATDGVVHPLREAMLDMSMSRVVIRVVERHAISIVCDDVIEDSEKAVLREKRQQQWEKLQAMGLQLDGQSDEHTDVTPGVIALENLTIIQSAAGTEFDSNALHIVSSGFNTIEISHCDFSSHCGTAVVVEGGDNIRFTSNRIHSSEKNGVFVRSGDICTMVENDVIGNRGHGIEVADGGNPNMMRNFIAYNGHCGALVWRGGMGKWIANHFFGNDTGGVSVSREGKPVMLENHIENNGARGLVVHDNGQGEYRLNIVSRHTEFECVIESPTSCPALDSNTFCRGIVGISVIDCAKPVLTSNTVHHMSIVAVEVLSGAEPVMRKNTIRDNQGPGITLNRCGSATVADNAVLDNQGIAAIVVEKESNPAIHGNDVQGGNIGILITGGRGIIWKNTISKCRTAGVQIDLSGNPSISDNQINACVGHGVVVCNGGKGKLSKNFIHHNSLFGVNISTDACAVVMENHIHDNIAGQLLAESGAAGIVKENNIFGSSPASICVCGICTVEIIKNSVANSQQNGSAILCQEEATALFDSNDVQHSGGNGVLVTESSNPIFKSNTVHDCAMSGFMFQSFATGTLRNNYVHSNLNAGLCVSSHANPQCIENHVFENAGCGLIVQNAGEGQYTGNVLYNNKDANVSIQTRGNPLIKENHIHTSASNGITVGNEAQGRVEHNEVYKNALCGVAVLSGGATMFSRNVISENCEDGINISGGALGEFAENTIHHNSGCGIRAEGRAAASRFVGNTVDSNLAWGAIIKHAPEKLSLDGNRICRNDHGGVWLVGSDCVLVRNHIGESAGPGVLVDGVSCAQVRRNCVTSGTSHGIILRDSTCTPIIADNEIERNAGVGIRVEAGVAGVVDMNKISNNCETGIIIETGSGISVTQNTLIRNGSCGIEINDHFSGQISENTICESQTHGISVSGVHSAPVIEKNKIEHCQLDGVHLVDSGGTLKENIIIAAERHGLLLQGQCHSELLKNHVSQCRQAAVQLCGRTTAVCLQNVVSNNEQEGVTIMETAQPTFEDNVVSLNKGGGMSVFAGGKVLRNRVHDNFKFGIKLEGVSASAYLRGNTISSNNGHGLLFQNNCARILVEHNKIVANTQTQVIVRTHADPQLIKNVVEDGPDGGVAVLESGVGNFQGNELVCNGRFQINVESNATPTFEHNRLATGQGSGIVVQNGGLGTFAHNSVANSSGPSVVVDNNDASDHQLSDDVSPSFCDNSITGGVAEGIIVKAGRAVFHNNTVSGCSGNSVQIEGGVVDFKQNCCTDGQAVGLCFSNGATGDVIDNTVSHHRCGLSVSGDADPKVSNNRFIGCKSHGGLIGPGGLGDYTGNTFESNEGSGCTLMSESSTIGFTKNTFCRNLSSGLEVHAAATLTIANNSVYGNHLSGIRLIGCSATVSNNDVYASLSVGIMCEGTSNTTTVSQNQVHHNEGAGIMVSDEANPTVSDNQIKDGISAGILINTCGRGTYHDNVIQLNAVVGVECVTGGMPVFENNLISENGLGTTGDGFCSRGGCCVHSKGEGQWRKNKFFDNAIGFSVLGMGSHPVVEENHIHKNRDHGVFCADQGQGVFQLNTIYANNKSNVTVTTQAKPAFTANVIRNSNHAGIIVMSDGTGVFVNNDVFDNKEANVEVLSSGNPSVMHNKIHHGKACGIFIHESGLGVFEDNDIFQNGTYGLETTTKGAPEMKDCELHGNCLAGVRSHCSGAGTLHACQVHSNGGHGLDLSYEASLLIHDSQIFDNAGGCGVLFTHSANGTLINTQIHGHVVCEIEIKSHSNPRIHKCDIYGGFGAGVLIHENARGLLEDNVIRTCSLDGIQVRSGAAPVVLKNRLVECDGAGIFVSDGGQGFFNHNEIRGNHWCGIEVRGEGTAAEFFSNQIMQHSRMGVTASNNAKLVLRENTIGQCGQGCVILAGVHNIIVQNNTLVDSKLVGVSATGCLSLDVSGNVFRDVEDLGIELLACTSALLSQNTFQSLSAGCVVAGDSKVNLQDNLFAKIEGRALHADCGSKVSITGGSFVNCGGLVFSDYSKVTADAVKFKNLTGKRGLSCESHASLKLNSCRVTECSDGITIQSQGSAVIVDSIVHDNTRGLVISQSGQIELTRNTICAQQTGIELMPMADVVMVGNMMSKNSVGMRVDKMAHLTVSPLHCNRTAASTRPAPSEPNATSTGVDAANDDVSDTGAVPEEPVDVSSDELLAEPISRPIVRGGMHDPIPVPVVQGEFMTEELALIVALELLDEEIAVA